MKRRSFLASIGALFSLPFLGKAAIPDDLLDCCDECERDDDGTEDFTEETSSDWGQESEVEWFIYCKQYDKYCKQYDKCRRRNPWRKECRGEDPPCILSYPGCDPNRKQALVPNSHGGGRHWVNIVDTL